jgi:hypothetical protein
MKTERRLQVLILLIIAGMAGAASFTHVHDWTMHNAPPGTGSWFGWANAIISELTPGAAGIEIRRRKRTHQPVAYPMAILIAAAILSLGAQVSQARPTIGGWLSAAVPALAFLALTKLVLSSPPAKTEETECAAQPASASGAPARCPASIPRPGATATVTSTTSTTPSTQESRSSSPDAHAQTAFPPDLGDLRPVPPGQLLISARMAVFSHQQQTGTPITPGELATRMNIPPALAESILDHLDDDGTPPPVTEANGTAINGSRP